MTQILEHMYKNFMRQFEYVRPHSFREIYVLKNYLFFHSKNHFPRFSYFFLVCRFGSNLYQVYARKYEEQYPTILNHFV